MKNTFFLISLFAFLFACSNENANNVDLTTEQQLEFSAKNFVNSTIAYEKNDEIKLGVSKDELLKSFNEYSSKFEIGPDAKSYIIEKIDQNYYVRFYHNGNENLVSTVALLKNDDKHDNGMITYRFGTTTCTTTVCNNCCGCVPNGDYCTRCELDSLACKRTTTDDQPISQ